MEAEQLDRLTQTAKNSLGANGTEVLWTGSAKTKETIVSKKGNEPKPVDYCRITGLPDDE